MISREYILKFEKRRYIYNFILKHPGLHLRELSRKTNTQFSCLRYHLNFLKKQGLIISKKDRRYTRYYIVQKVGKYEKDIFNLLRQEVPRRIILLLLLPGPGDIYQNKKYQDKALANPNTYLKTYSKKELVELTKFWNGPYGSFFHLRKSRTTINFHLKKILDADLIDKIKIGKEIKYKLKNEDMIWAFLIKYKNALSIDSIDLYLTWQDNALKDITESMIKVVFNIFPNPYHV
jgi:DNA-binding transcriptional ArsR family regulator